MGLRATPPTPSSWRTRAGPSPRPQQAITLAGLDLLGKKKKMGDRGWKVNINYSEERLPLLGSHGCNFKMTVSFQYVGLSYSISPASAWRSRSDPDIVTVRRLVAAPCNILSELVLKRTCF